MERSEAPLTVLGFVVAVEDLAAVAAVSRAREADEQHVVVAQRCPNPNASVPDQIAPRATT
jgi:hypothetical protein